ncbi:hypothetical protein GCM10009716_04850 [Streptomyces sodiiphilus]|uniref:DUF8094 domain-containing protein n=1 Tax=Streptomyces sodiiphilus TaxID=226217 RepID=A0ABP5A3H7_9ACTN
MRVRARVTTAAAGLALAMTVSLSGCITVHGERAVLPAVSPEEAEEVLADFTRSTNEANAAYDAELNAQIETGPLGAINRAGLTARGEVNPGGNESYEPLEFTDTRFRIPQQAGWPKFFVADTLSSRHEENRWLLVFTRSGPQEDWLASYLAVLPPGDLPPLAEDEEGHAVAVGPDGSRAGGAADGPAGEGQDGPELAPRDLPGAYTGHLASGDGPFAEGVHTSGILRAREEASDEPAFVMQYQDLPAERPAYAPVALMTADGGMLVLFSSHHHEKQTMAEGETPVVDPLVEVLMEGTATRSVTLVRDAMQAAHVPPGTGDVEILGRITGIVSAKGE